MGLYMGLESVEDFRLGRSPKTILPSCKPAVKSESENRDAKGKATFRDMLSLDMDFEGNCFSPDPNFCKSIPPIGAEIEGDRVHKRGSIYQSSKEVGRMKDLRAFDRRRNIKNLCCNDSFPPYRIVDCLYNLDEESEDVEQKMSPPPVRRPYRSMCSVSSLELSFHTPPSLSSSPAPDLSLNGSLKGGNDLPKSEAAVKNFAKALSPKMQIKTHQGSPRFVAEPDEITVGHWRTKIFRNSPLQDLLNMTPLSKSSSLPIEPNCMVGTCSPSHLQGCLKLKHRHGLTSFKFSLKCPKETLVARTWKADSAFNWAYTFHSVCDRQKSNASVWGLKDSNRDSSMAGQMKVSRYSCRDIKDGGGLDNTVVMEFVLYDIKSHVLYGSKEDGSDYSDNSSSTFNPLAPAGLHPYLENAAIVIQVPSKKRESMKNQWTRNKKSPTLIDLFMGNVVSQTKVSVVTPTGNHGSPSTESRGGPLRLLDRWRSGGGCDCGGWDMGCPLNVFSNLSAEDCLLLENGKPLQLFVQGAKEKLPALTIKHVEKEQYAVEFHAQLSTLQAFSICVAMLHGAEVSTAVGEGRKDQLLLQNDQRKSRAVAKEKMIKATKTVQKIPPTFMVSPPLFSCV